MPLNALTFLMISIGALYALFVIFLMIKLPKILNKIFDKFLKINTFKKFADICNKFLKITGKIIFYIIAASFIIYFIYTILLSGRYLCDLILFLFFVIGIILWIIISEKINNYRPERKFDEYNEIEKLKEKLDFAITSAKILLFIIFFVSYSLLLIYLISKIPARLNYFYFPYLQ